MTIVPHLFVVVQLSPSIYAIDIAEFSGLFNLRIHTLPVHETIGPRYRLPAFLLAGLVTP